MRFGQGLIQSLINPAYGQGLFQAGQLMGSAPGRAREAEEQRLREQQQQAGLLSAYQMGTDPGGSNPAAAMAAIAQGTGASAPDLVSMMEAGRASQKTPIEGKDRFVPVGSNVFDTRLGKWLKNPTKEDVENLTPDNAARLYQNFTPESVQNFLDDPKAILVPIDATEEAEAEERSAMDVAGRLASTDRLIGKVDEAMKQAEDVFGLTYDISKFLPLTDARSLRGLVDTINSNLAFDRLQKMRDESKTGGALGQVSNIELNLLRSSVEALDPAAGSEVFKNRLKSVKEHYQNFRNALMGQPPVGPGYKTREGKVYYNTDNTPTGWVEIGDI